MTECAARCGTLLHPAAAAGGFDRHPGCEQGLPATEWRWACVRCGNTGPARDAMHALSCIDRHDKQCPKKKGGSAQK
jgi:hypothetical protein